MYIYTHTRTHTHTHTYTHTHTHTHTHSYIHIHRVLRHARNEELLSAVITLERKLPSPVARAQGNQLRPPTETNVDVPLVCCSVLQSVRVWQCCGYLQNPTWTCSQCVVVCCSVLQCGVVYCSVLQCVVVCRGRLQKPTWTCPWYNFSKFNLRPHWLYAYAYRADFSEFSSADVSF